MEKEIEREERKEKKKIDDDDDEEDEEEELIPEKKRKRKRRKGRTAFCCWVCARLHSKEQGQGDLEDISPGPSHYQR